MINCNANSVSWAELSESQRDIETSSWSQNIIIIDIICYVDYYSSAKFKLPT